MSLSSRWGHEGGVRDLDEDQGMYDLGIDPQRQRWMECEGESDVAASVAASVVTTTTEIQGGIGY